MSNQPLLQTVPASQRYIETPGIPSASCRAPLHWPKNGRRMLRMVDMPSNCSHPALKAVRRLTKLLSCCSNFCNSLRWYLVVFAASLLMLYCRFATKCFTSRLGGTKHQAISVQDDFIAHDLQASWIACHTSHLIQASPPQPISAPHFRCLLSPHNSHPSTSSHYSLHNLHHIM